MATKRINQLDVIGTTIDDNDRFVADHDKGSADFETQQFKWETIRDQIGLDFIRLESTGILTGGEITRISTTQFSGAAGTGQIVDHVTGTITPVSWPAFSGITPDYLTTADEQYTYVYIDNVGDLQQQNLPFDADDFRNKIVLGMVTHTVVTPGAAPSSKIIIKVSSLARKLITQTVEYAFDANAEISIKVTKPFRITGSTNNNLNLGLEIVDTSIGGEVQIIGGGDSATPNYLPVSAVAEYTSCYLGYIKSTGEPTIWFQESGITNPSVYNPPGSNWVLLNEDWWVVHRLYYYPDQDYPIVLTGRQQYESLHTALLNYKEEETNDLEIFSKYLKPTVFIGYLVVKDGTTNLNNSDDAVFISALDARGGRYIDNINCGIVGGLTVTDEGFTDIAWPGGQIYSICLGKTKDVDAGTADLNAGNGIYYVYWHDGSGVINSTTKPSLPDVLLARAGVQNDDIVELFQENFLTTDFTKIKEGLDENFALSVVEGMLLEPDPDVSFNLDVKMTQGSYWINLRVKHPVSAVDTLTTPMIRYFHTSSLWTDDSNAEIDTNNYDNGTNRVAIPANKWCVGVFSYQHDEQNDVSLIAWFYPTVLHDNQTAAVLYANQIANGEIAIPNQPPGFVNSPTLMAYVFRQADTTLAAAGTIRWVDLRPRVGNFVGGGGGAIVAVDGLQVYFVGKHGNDSNNGKSWEEAFLTIPTALSAAVAQSPSSTNVFSIVGYDAGIYADNISLPAWTKLYMPNATTTGNIALIANSWVSFKEIRGGQITTIASSGRAIIDALLLDGSASQISIDVTSTGCNVNGTFERINVEANGTGVQMNKTGGFLNLKVGQMIFLDDNSIGIEAKAGDINFHCEILANAGGVTTSTGVKTTGGIANVYNTGTNTANTPWNEVSGTINRISTSDGIKIATDIICDDITCDDLTSHSLLYPTADGSNGQVITTNGGGTLSFQTVSGGLIQRINSSVHVASSGATTIPHDNTIPQINEGTQLVTATITPTSTSNFWRIIAQLFFAPSPGSVYTTASIGVGIGGVPQANCVLAVSNYETNNNGTSIITLDEFIPIASLSQHQFELRYGNNAGTTVYINSTSAVAPLFGGVANTYLRVEEWLP